MFSKVRMILIVPLFLFAPQVMALTEGYVPEAWDYIFYTFALSGVVFATLIIIAYKEYKWLVYALFSLLLVLSTAGMDGTLAHLVGKSDFVIWVVPLLLNAGIASYGYAMIAIRLEPPHRLERLKSLFLILACVSALFPLTSYFWLEKIPLPTVWVPVNILFFGMVLGQILPPLTWPSNDKWLLLFIRIFPVVVGLFAVGSYWFHFSSVGSTQHDSNALNRFILLLFAFFSLTIVIWKIFSNTRIKEAVERSAIDDARIKAEMELTLLQADQAYEEAVSAATKHRMQLATVSHDLKQPISALRVAIDQLQKKKTGESAEKLVKAIDYIDSLSQSYVDEGLEEETAEEQVDKEEVAAAIFIKALHQMFAAEALQKSIEFHIIPSSHWLVVEPLPAMRMMTNLISNAIGHSGASRILIGFRRKGNKVIFQVHDNGCGMNKAMLEKVFMPGQKGEKSEGSGLGLSIVQELSREHGMPLTFNSFPGRGTSAYIEMEHLAT